MYLKQINKTLTLFLLTRQRTHTAGCFIKPDENGAVSGIFSNLFIKLCLQVATLNIITDKYHVKLCIDKFIPIANHLYHLAILKEAHLFLI